MAALATATWHPLLYRSLLPDNRPQRGFGVQNKLIQEGAVTDVRRPVSLENPERTMLRTSMVALLVLGCATAAAVAQTAPPPPPPADYGPPGPGRHPPMMAGFDQIGLTDAQKASIHQIMDSHREEMKSMRQSEWQQHKSFETLDPSAPTYASQVNVIAQQAASLASQRVQQMAAVKTQIYAVLTTEQKAQLASFAASEPPPPQQAQ